MEASHHISLINVLLLCQCQFNYVAMTATFINSQGIMKRQTELSKWVIRSKKLRNSLFDDDKTIEKTSR